MDGLLFVKFGRGGLRVDVADAPDLEDALRLQQLADRIRRLVLRELRGIRTAA